MMPDMQDGGTKKKIYRFRPRTEIVIREFNGLTDKSKKSY
jgi:hypothetical protein